jgi:hypothetical protein
MEPFDALDEDLDEAQPHAPAGLHAVGERLLARAAELELDDRAARLSSSDCCECCERSDGSSTAAASRRALSTATCSSGRRVGFRGA